MFPLPNVEGQAGYNFSSQAPANQPRREELLRLDFHPSDRWRFTGRYMESKDEQELPYGVGGSAVSSNVPIVQGRFDIPGVQLDDLGQRNPRPQDVARGERGERAQLD